jgi:hypothetical protein
MSFLPIVERELRVASRRWSTFLIRPGVGLLAIAIGLPALFLGWMTGGSTGSGQGAFTALSHYTFALAVLGGLALTADSLSAEKRQGTIGFLFLTDLRGYDVVLGKFAALGLHSMYGMLALFPVLALPLLSGGVTGREFWCVCLALFNLLFVSLSAGMVVSAGCRDAGRAFVITFILLLCLLGGLPLAAMLAQKLFGAGWMSRLTWINPGRAFAVAKSGSLAGSFQDYWASLGLSHLMGWIFLVVAGLLLPRSWQDSDQPLARSSWPGRLAGDRLSRLFRTSRSPVWLERNPMLWLMGERPVLKILLWSIAGAWCVCAVVALVMLEVEGAAAVMFGSGFLVLFIFALALVEHACRFWVESRQNGNLETLLAVPLDSREMLSSHWASIRRHFLWPLVMVLGAATLPACLAVARGIMKQGGGESHLFESLFLFVYLGGILLWFLATFIAIGYTGPWLALKLRRPQFASGLTLLCVVVLPTLFCWLGFGVTLVFIFLPMSLLQSNLRGMILQRYLPADGMAAGGRR